MAYDAALRNLAVIGEAVRALPSETRDGMPEILGLRSRGYETSSFTSTSA